MPFHIPARALAMSLRSSRGFTLIEFIIALVLGLLIVAVGLSVGFGRAQDANAQELQSAITQVRQTADGAYAQSIGYVTSDGVPVSGPGLFALDNRLPEGVVNTAPSGSPTAAQIQNGWGGAFSLGVESTTASATPACAAGPSGAANDLLTITVDKIPSKACITLLSGLAPQMYDSYVNGKLVALSPGPGNGVQGRSGVNVSQAGPLCSAQPVASIKFRSLKPVNIADLRSNPMTSTMTATEQACVTPQYNRIQNAMAAREAAQSAL